MAFEKKSEDLNRDLTLLDHETLLIEKEGSN